MTNFRTVISFLVLIIFLMSPALLATENLNPRIQIGLNLIPAVIAANKRLNDESNTMPLTIHIIYRHNKQQALISKKQLGSINNIRGHELNVEVIHFNDLANQSIQRDDALFINENMGRGLAVLIQYAQSQKNILFSPFKGDVKKGVMSGFDVTNKVLPAINLTAMKKSNIELKAFFLRIAVKYDQ